MTGTAIATKDEIKSTERATPVMLKRFLRRKSDEMQRIAAAGLNTDAIIEGAALAVIANAELQKCTVGSIFLAVQWANKFGLNVGGFTQEAHIVPYNVKISKKGEPDRWEVQAQLIPGYPGLVKMIVNTGIVSHIQAHVLYEDDVFEYSEFVGGAPRYVPNLRSKRRTDADIWGAFAIAKMKDGTIIVDFMTRDEIEKCRHCGKQPNGLMWTKASPEACKKTAIRRLAKPMPKASVPQSVARTIDAAMDASLEIEPADMPLNTAEVPTAEFTEDAAPISPSELVAAWKAAGITMSSSLFESILLREVKDWGEALAECSDDDLMKLLAFAEEKRQK